MLRYICKKRGFTLIEMVLTIVIVSVGLFGMMVLYSNSMTNISETDVNLMATYLAREKLEQLVSDKVGYGYASLENVNYPEYAGEDITLGTIQFTRSFNIHEVSKVDFETPEDESGYKRIDMTVGWPAGGGITLSTIVAEYVM